jgi:hypothetical protein
MNIPEGWPTEEMIDAGEGVDPNEHASKGSWVQSVLEAALAAAPTPPAQDDEPVYQINLGPDKWWDVDKEAFDQVTIDAPQKRVLYTRPQPKAQEDEPVAVVTEENGEQVIDITRLMTLSRGTKIYARPANDELRRAAEETLSIIEELAKRSSLGMFNGKDVWTLSINLRAALGVK